jgi:hypothetical protein
MALKALVEVGPYQILHHPGHQSGAADLVIACASIGHDLSRPPSPEWVKSATSGGQSALILIDAARSWASAPGLNEALAQALARLPPPNRSLALGVSMGAVMAMALSHMIDLTALIAIGPQSAAKAPWENRWSALTARLPPLPLPSSRAGQTWILHGADDSAQAAPFPRAQRLTFPGQSHSTLAPHLKPAMPGLIAAALAQDRRRFLRIAKAAGGQTPEMP